MRKHIKRVLPKILYIYLLYSLLTLGYTSSYFTDTETNHIQFNTYQDLPKTTLQKSTNPTPDTKIDTENQTLTITPVPAELNQTLTIHYILNISQTLKIEHNNHTQLFSFNHIYNYTPKDIGNYTFTIQTTNITKTLSVIDLHPPTLSEPTVTFNKYNEITISAIVFDNHQITKVSIEYYFDNTTQRIADMKHKENNTYETTITFFENHTNITYQFSAMDFSNNRATTDRYYTSLEGQ